jgi:tripartite-type tricarboxylate transporter receptor subunit TctC
VENPEFRQIMEERGFTLDYLSPADSEAFVRNELATLTALYEELPWK